MKLRTTRKTYRTPPICPSCTGMMEYIPAQHPCDELPSGWPGGWTCSDCVYDREDEEPDGDALFDAMREERAELADALKSLAPNRTDAEHKAAAERMQQNIAGLTNVQAQLDALKAKVHERFNDRPTNL